MSLLAQPETQGPAFQASAGSCALARSLHFLHFRRGTGRRPPGSLPEQLRVTPSPRCSEGVSSSSTAHFVDEETESQRKVRLCPAQRASLYGLAQARTRRRGFLYISWGAGRPRTQDWRSFPCDVSVCLPAAWGPRRRRGGGEGQHPRPGSPTSGQAGNEGKCVL